MRKCLCDFEPYFHGKAKIIISIALCGQVVGKDEMYTKKK